VAGGGTAAAGPASGEVGSAGSGVAALVTSRILPEPPDTGAPTTAGRRRRADDGPEP